MPTVLGWGGGGAVLGPPLKTLPTKRAHSNSSDPAATPTPLLCIVMWVFRPTLCHTSLHLAQPSKPRPHSPQHTLSLLVAGPKGPGKAANSFAVASRLTPPPPWSSEPRPARPPPPSWELRLLLPERLLAGLVPAPAPGAAKQAGSCDSWVVVTGADKMPA